MDEPNKSERRECVCVRVQRFLLDSWLRGPDTFDRSINNHFYGYLIEVTRRISN